MPPEPPSSFAKPIEKDPPDRVLGCGHLFKHLVYGGSLGGTAADNSVAGDDYYVCGFCRGALRELKEANTPSRCEGCGRVGELVRPVTFVRSGGDWVSGLCGRCLKDYLVAGVDVARVGEIRGG